MNGVTEMTWESNAAWKPRAAVQLGHYWQFIP